MQLKRIERNARDGQGARVRRELGRWVRLVLLGASVIVAQVAHAQAPLAQAPASIEFSAQEIRQILTLGPWPPAASVDPGNRVSGKAQAIELGRRLFRDPRMSPVGYISCVTCHQPDRSFTDLKARAHGLADLPRNTPTLLNLSRQRWFGWDGASDSLWMASIRPMLDSREFDSSPATVAKLFKRDPELAACYRKVFQRSPLGDPQRTLVNVGKALAAYQETLVTARTPFDAFRDAMAGLPGAPSGSAGPSGRSASPAPPPAYPAAAQRGLKLFVGQAGCIACHQGANFSDQRFHKVLAAPGDAGGNPAGSAGGGNERPADAGRLGGAISLKNNPLNLAGAYNDDPRRANQRATQRRLVKEDMRGQFRTPSLRNVAATAPYMHDGRMDRLQDAVRHGGYGKTAPSAEAVAAPALSEQQAQDMVAFLASLTDAYGQRRPWTSDAMARCP